MGRSFLLAFLLFSAVWFFSTSRGSHYFVRFLEWPYPPILPEQCPAGEAIAVLAGTGLPRDHPLRSFETPNRMDGALALYKAARAPFIILTTEEGALNRLAAIRRGIPAECILLAGAAQNTAAEARIITNVAVQHHWHKLVLVTSAFHMRRSALLVQRAAAALKYRLIIIAYPVDWQQIPAVPRGQSSWVPNQYGIELFKKTLKEELGYALYTF